MIAFPCTGDNCSAPNCGQGGGGGGGGDCTRAPRLTANANFYQAALMGEDTVIVNYYDPSTESMYAVTIPNDLNVLQWETSVALRE